MTWWTQRTARLSLLVLMAALGAPVASASSSRTHHGSSPRGAQRQAEEAGVRHEGVVALLGRRGLACSGVLIAPRWVLTARHCRGIQRVVFGADAADLRQQREVLKFYGAPNPALDMALLELSSVAPVAPYGLYASEPPPSRVRIVGFGCWDAECRRQPGLRSYFEVPLRPGSWGCDEREAAALRCAPGSEMVLRRLGAGDTCTGDSGGAALASVDGDWRVVAITSRAAGDASLRCGEGGVYVRVSSARAWIDAKVRE